MTTYTPELAGATPRPRRSRTGPILLLVFGTLVALTALGALAGGGFVAWANHTQRDADGYFMTGGHRFATTSYALAQTGVDLQDFPSWVQPGDLGTIRIRATSADGKALFVGIGRERAVEHWLAGVSHDELKNVDYKPFSVDYERQRGGAPASAPADAGIWAVSTAGKGTKTVTWGPGEGSWAAVVMNADGSRAVAADIAVGADVHYLGWVEAGLFGFGALLLSGAATMLYFGGRGLDGSRGARPSAGTGAAA
jgi:hypothetical protein